MTTPTLDSVKAYYDERIEGKIRDFIRPNPRIEAAIQTLAEWAPFDPKRILEIGCGIGATTWRLARAWPHAEVVGTDVSAASIQVARSCFPRPNLTYRDGLIWESGLAGKFDFVVLMDVYEHIPLHDRSTLHSLLRSLLADESRVFLSFPTPALQRYGIDGPSDLQPVDEDITPSDVITLAEETNTQILYYRQVGIWRYGDYAHLVLGRYKSLADVTLRKPRPGRIAGIKSNLKKFFRNSQSPCTELYDYLGSDLLRPSTRNSHRRLSVSIAERESLAASWFRNRAGHNSRI